MTICIFAGGLADLLDMHPMTLARQLVPAALPVFIDQQDRAALMHLARQAGLPLPTLLHQYGHYAVAKHVFEGAPSQPEWGRERPHYLLAAWIHGPCTIYDTGHPV